MCIEDELTLKKAEDKYAPLLCQKLQFLITSPHAILDSREFAFSRVCCSLASLHSREFVAVSRLQSREFAFSLVCSLALAVSRVCMLASGHARELAILRVCSLTFAVSRDSILASWPSPGFAVLRAGRLASALR
ncbi:hypothetical protein BT69DRAFT_1303048 [Atractiella rhizophila]|nr:hypothetical protein BT69DRAFT_1303048 [Atractiella rhizophila]